MRPRSIDSLDALRLQRGAEHLHCLGPRALAEFLASVSGTIGGLPCILRELAEYQNRLTPEMVRRAGGDRFPRRQIAEAPR